MDGWEGMVRFIRALSHRTEFAVVVLVGLAPFIVESTISIIRQPVGPLISDGRLIALIIHEFLVLAALAGFAHVRGWTLRRVGLAPLKAADIIRGFGLVFLTMAINWVLWRLLWNIAPAIVVAAAGRAQTMVAHDLDLATVLAVSCLNGVFEEVLVCGYVCTALKERYGEWPAIHASTALRLSYHLYQGSLGVITIVPLGLLFAVAYLRGGRLWPLVLAHAEIDMFSLASFIGR